MFLGYAWNIHRLPHLHFYRVPLLLFGFHVSFYRSFVFNKEIYGFKKCGNLVDNKLNGRSEEWRFFLCLAFRSHST